MLIEAVPYYRTIAPAMQSTDPDFESKVDELSQHIGEDTYFLDTEFADEVRNPIEDTFPENLTFDTTEKEGNIVHGVINDYPSTQEESLLLADLIPEITTYNYIFEVNPEEESLTLTIEMVVPETPQNEDAIEGISLFTEGTTKSSSVHTITDKSLPAYDDSNVIPYDEFLEILTELDLPILF